MESNQQKTARRISSRRSSVPSSSTNAAAGPSQVAGPAENPRNPGPKKHQLLVSNFLIHDEPHQLVEPMEEDPNERTIVTVIGPSSEGDHVVGASDADEAPLCALCSLPTKWFKVDYNGRQALEVNGCTACKQIGSKSRVTETYIEEPDYDPLEDDSKELETEQDYIDYVRDLMEKNFGEKNAEPPVLVKIDTSAVKRIEKEFEKFLPLLPKLPEGVFYNPEWQGQGQKHAI